MGGREASGSFEKEGGSIQVMEGMGVVYSDDSMVNQRRRKERREVKCRKKWREIEESARLEGLVGTTGRYGRLG